MHMLRSVLLLAVAFVPACAIGRQDTNDPIDATVVARLEPGRTTAREVVELLGGPTEVVQLGRRTAYRYDASTTKSAVLFLVVLNFGNQDTRQDRVWVFFDENDVLTHYGSTYGTHRTQYAMPWEDVHEASDNESRDQERPGVGR
jgi:outer membrane protein assembly factor BamE (lipoprotein component of BamABCDE complex)